MISGDTDRKKTLVLRAQTRAGTRALASTQYRTCHSGGHGLAGHARRRRSRRGRCRRRGRVHTLHARRQRRRQQQGGAGGSRGPLRRRCRCDLALVLRPGGAGCHDQEGRWRAKRPLHRSHQRLLPRRAWAAELLCAHPAPILLLLLPACRAGSSLAWSFHPSDGTMASVCSHSQTATRRSPCSALSAPVTPSPRTSTPSSSPTWKASKSSVVVRKHPFFVAILLLNDDDHLPRQARDERKEC